jgi:hypothetical protein
MITGYVNIPYALLLKAFFMPAIVSAKRTCCDAMAGLEATRSPTGVLSCNSGADEAGRREEGYERDR